MAEPVSRRFSLLANPPMGIPRMRIRILLIEEDGAAREAIEGVVASLGYDSTSVTGGTQALEAMAKTAFDLCVLSLALPPDAIRNLMASAQSRKTAVPVVARAQQAKMTEIIAAFRAGAVDFITHPCHPALLAEVIERALSERGRVGSALRTSCASLAGEHPALQVVLERVDQVADSDACVLIRGEEGTGKEAVARLIHACGSRRAGPFVTVRLGGDARPSTAELFGGVRALSQAANDPPLTRLEEAEHGTLFIDEVAALSRESQIGLLRLVRDPNQRARADVRIVAATTHNLEQAVREGSFVEDLYYRLNIIPIEIPPLRDRLEDIPMLVEHFRRSANASGGFAVPPFGPEMLVRLGDNPWPGNVRQLETVVSNLVAAAKTRAVSVEDLPASLRTDVKSLGSSIMDLPPHGVDLRLLLNQLEDRLIGQALERTGGNKNRAAELLGLNRTTLVEKLRRRTVA
jgi:DNA-binding NtrC family response regulator